ncbi:MAG: SpoIIE family protein phosphatase [Thermoleophilia bacterium]|nr:SpoIIE family protein phosphatase [Thermoleophilia bacterium]
MVERERAEGDPAGVAPRSVTTAARERLAAGDTLEERLTALVEAAAGAAHADTVVVRLLDPATGMLVARAVTSSSPAVAAELEGSQIPPAAVSPDGRDPDALPSDSRRLARRSGAEAALVIGVGEPGQLLGCLEFVRHRRPFDASERLLAQLTAGQVALLAGVGAGGDPAEPGADAAPLDAAGEALAAAAEGSRVGPVVARLAARATGAVGAVLWDLDDGAPPHLAARVGASAELAAEPPVPPQSGDRRAVVVEPHGNGVAAVATLRLGEAPASLLQLYLAEVPSPELAGALARFGARAGQALRASRRAGRAAAELERTRALLAVVGQAIAELSLSHTLETAVGRVAELLHADRVGVYLREHGVLRPAAERGVAAGHAAVAEALLELSLGPFRARGVFTVADAGNDPRLDEVRADVQAAAVEAVAAVPLVVGDEAIGLLVAYLERGRTPSDDETALLAALAAQLGVAVQNARLHEEAKRLGADRTRALQRERQAARRLRAFYEVSQSFTRSLDLEDTLAALARTAVELLDADGAVIRTHDRRRAALVSQAVHVAEDRLEPVVGAILARPHAVDGKTAERLVEDRQPLLLTRDTAVALGEAYEVLVPFLDRGASAAVVPVATVGELIATLTVVSLDAGRPIGEEALEAAASLAAHAVLAIDNARLYEQQKHFLEAMQRSLLPRTLPDVPALEIGSVYESAARLEVGGDVWDYMPLDERRLAVIVGDVSGHGVDAAADMAMAKFVFRSLAREHPEPGNFLAAANDVVVGEIALGKFITMVYLTADGTTGDVVGAVAGHPPPRIVRAGRVEAFGARGVALGVDAGQRYDAVRTRLAPSDAVVLYTDGVIEARRDGEQYGEARLDAVLAANADLPAGELAAAVVADCRAFAAELVDDCAVVVVKRA